MIEELKKSTGCLVDYEIEWILIDNRNNAFSSAASALNYGFDKSSSQIVFFIHQDIILFDQITIDRVVSAVEKNNIVGFAGRLSNGGEIVSTIYEGPQKEKKYFYNFNDSEFVNVLTCDECFVAMNREIFEKVGGFDQKNFDGWHFYGVDLTLRAAERNIPVVIVETNAWHRSHGVLDSNFDRYKNILRKKYKGNYNKIYYPCGWTYTNSIKFYCRYLARTVKRMIKRER